jgi:hypothetical protein
MEDSAEPDDNSGVSPSAAMWALLATILLLAAGSAVVAGHEAVMRMQASGVPTPEPEP